MPLPATRKSIGLPESDRRREWGDLTARPHTHLIASSLMQLLTQPVTVDKKVKPINQGDLLVSLVPDGVELVLATGEQVGSQPLYSRGHLNDARTPLTFPPAYKVATGIPVQLPEKTPLPFVDTFSAQPYLVQPPDIVADATILSATTNDYSQLSDLGLPRGEKKHHVTKLKLIVSIDEIDFSNKDGLLPFDYLLIGKNGIPIIISDYHQKQAIHIAQLISLELLSNIKPLIDWIDAHFDDAFLEVLTKYTHLESMETILDICSKAPSSTAAILLYQAGLAEIRYFPQLALCDEHLNPSPQDRRTMKINPFNHTNAFARPNNQPHLLSYDLDQVNLFCKAVGKDGKLDQKTTQNYLAWLKANGMSSDNYEAVFMYASPGYIVNGYRSDVHVRDSVKAIISLFI